MILCIDIGNTHTHLGLGDSERILATSQFLTGGWAGALPRIRELAGSADPEAVVLASVVPEATRKAMPLLAGAFGLQPVLLTHANVSGIGIDYPRPETIGADRLANAMAATRHYGAPVVVVDFGTAVTFDVVDPQSRYIGGIIAPGLSALTDHLHQSTALLPRLDLEEPPGSIGKSTTEAMLIGTVQGYRGLIGHLLDRLAGELDAPDLQAVATGGYAPLLCKAVSRIGSIHPHLTLEGLRLLGLSLPPKPLQAQDGAV